MSRLLASLATLVFSFTLGCGRFDLARTMNSFSEDALYGAVEIQLTSGAAIQPLVPVVPGGAGQEFSILPELPAGLRLDPMTGVISGAPQSAVLRSEHRILMKRGGRTREFRVVLTIQPEGYVPPLNWSGRIPNTDAPVTDAQLLGNKLYLAGNFYNTYPYVGSGVFMNRFSGSVAAAATIDGAVTVAVPDPSTPGAMFIAGEFTRIGGVERAGLARLLPNGSLDRDFVFDLVDAGRVRTDGLGHSLLVLDGYLYVAGRFTHVRPGGRAPATRDCLFRVQLASRELDSWSPRFVFGGAIREITQVVSPGSEQVVVFGPFASADSDAAGLYSDRLSVAMFSGSSMSLDDWDLQFPMDNSGRVLSIAAGANTIVVNGSMAQSRGRTISALTAFSTAPTVDIRWTMAHDAAGLGNVDRLVTLGNTLYLCAGSELRAINVTTGVITGNVDVDGAPGTDSTYGPDNALAPVGGELWYLAARIGRGDHSGSTIFRLNPANLAVLGEIDSAVDGPVHTLLEGLDNRVLLGGSFSGASRTFFPNRAVVNIETGTSSAWPLGLNPDEYVMRFRILNGKVFALKAGGSMPPQVVIFDLRTGARLASADIQYMPSDLLVSSDSIVVLGNVSSQNTNELRAQGLRYSGSTLQLTYNFSANNFLRKGIVVGPNAYLVGGFTTIAGLDRRYVAAFDLATGRFLDFNPQPVTMPAGIDAIGAKLFLSGQNVNDPNPENEQRRPLAQYGPLPSATITSWFASEALGHTLTDVVVANGGVFALSNFSIGGLSGRSIIGWNLDGTLLRQFIPQRGMTPNTSADTERLQAVGDSLMIRFYNSGAQAGLYGGKIRRGFAILDPRSGLHR